MSGQGADGPVAYGILPTPRYLPRWTSGELEWPLTQVDSSHPAGPPVEGVPLISIVTVALNAASSIEDTIASVSAQQVDFAVEHICVDGGSVDGTRAIIDRCASAVRIVRIFEPDSGIF